MSVLHASDDFYLGDVFKIALESVWTQERWSNKKIEKITQFILFIGVLNHEKWHRRDM
jgi:hypothetical protein